MGLIMREETVTYKIFKFEELLPKAQDKALQNQRDWNVEGFEWWDATYEGFKDDLKEKGFNDVEIFFTGFWSQGDGACFDCKSFDYPKLIEALKDRIPDKRYHQYKRFIPKLDIGISIETLGHHYCHSRTRKLSIEYYHAGKHHRINALVENFQDDLENLRLDWCNKIYHDLEKEYEYLTSDEAIKESIEYNDLEFFETGKVYCINQ
jgi:hypothetical protein